MPQRKLLFEYPHRLVREQKTGNIIRVYRPLIPVQLVFDKRSTDMFHALVDSGSDRNLFPAALGVQLGINVREGRMGEMAGVGDYRVTVYTWKVKLIIAAPGSIAFDTEIDFCYDHRIPLLGRKGFFNLFKKVEFREMKRTVELTL